MRTARGVRAFVLCLLVVSWPLGQVAAAQPAAPPNDSPTPARPPVSRAQSWQQERGAASANEDVTTLRRRLAEQFRLIPIRDGVLLVPRRAGRTFKGVELRQGSIAIDGQVVTGEEVRTRLGADADRVLAASYLDPASLLEPAPVPGRDASASSREVPAGATPPEMPVPPHHRSARVSFGRDLVIEDNERVDDAAVAIFGSVTVNGEVNGDVVAVLGDIRVGPRASVRGNLTAVGGSVSTDPAARLYGGSNEVAIRVPDASVHVRDLAGRVGGWRPGPRWWAGVSTAWTLFRLSLVALFALALAAVARGPVDRMRAQLRDAPLATTLVGVAAQVLLLPALAAVALLLLLSIVGIPLLALLPFALLAGLIAWTAGFAAVAESLGQRLGGTARPFANLVLGLVLIWIVTLLARAAGLGGVGVVAGTLGVLGFLIEFVAWSAALGALILGWRRRRVHRPDYAPVPPVTSAPVQW